MNCNSRSHKDVKTEEENEETTWPEPEVVWIKEENLTNDAYLQPQLDSLSESGVVEGSRDLQMQVEGEPYCIVSTSNGKTPEQDTVTESVKVEMIEEQPEVMIRIKLEEFSGDEDDPLQLSVHSSSAFDDKVSTGNADSSSHTCDEMIPNPTSSCSPIPVTYGEGVNSPNGDTFFCSSCSMGFSQMIYLLRHWESHYPEKGRHTCDVCRKTFDNASTLKKHYQFIHTDEKPLLACHLCTKSFARTYNLTRHLRTCSGERPFPCHLCAKSFREKARLTCHLRRHSGERPFLCHLCAKSFRKKANFKRHLEIHSGLSRKSLSQELFKENISSPS